MTICPWRSRITVPAGMWSSRPGIRGEATTVSRVVGASMWMVPAGSSRGIQIVYGMMVVRAASSWTRAA
ncbi:MAG TPA: hypothetical protein VH165_14235 [Kofleriaceae bacterium]|nr:hypothetical protein [Kofleriaceae bacterium]